MSLAPRMQDLLRAELELGAGPVVVGDSVELVVRLQHPAGVHYELVPEGFDYSWVLLSRGGAVTTTAGEVSETTYRLTLCSLEAGERELPAPVFHNQSGTPVSVALAPLPTLSVRGVLAETEDAPRPIIGFMEPTAADGGLSWGWIVLPLLVCIALALWIARRRRARSTPGAPLPTPEQRLAVLEASDLGAAGEPSFAANLHVELTGLVREHFDLRAGGGRASLTDDEWLAAAALEFSEQQRVALHALFLESREVKYGGATPTHWALQESLAAARRVLTGVPTAAEVSS